MARVEPRLARHVNHAIKEKGWSQREAARQAALRGLDLSFSTVQAMSAGLVPGPEKLLAIALTTGINPDRLFALAGYPLRYDASVLEEAQDLRDPERRLAGNGEAFLPVPA
jgi:transcriptional regulator with XRE-family HTH domain